MIRRQLTMFVPEPVASAIESVRRVLDPIQSSLIAAHVTLCREDELLNLNAIRRRLQQSMPAAITLRFGAPQVFMGHGILLECAAGLDAFRALRMQVLESDAVRDQAPHITLAHPRNPQAPRSSLQAATELSAGLEIIFGEVALIEQHGKERWTVLDRYPLG
jgi:2'-5' RNA ligase